MDSDMHEGSLSKYTLNMSESGKSVRICSLSSDVSDNIIAAALSDHPDRETVILQEVRITKKIESALLNMPKLSSLALQSGSFSSLSFLGEARHLTELTLRWGCSKGIGDVRQLKRLNADSDEITDMSVLEPLQELEELHFSSGYGGDFPASSEIYNVSPLKYLPKLHTLSLSFRGKDLSGFAELSQIKTLILDIDSRFDDLEPIGKLTQLEGLGLSSSYSRRHKITDITPLAALINLRILRISDEKVKSLESLKFMSKLQKLDCSKNHIRTVKPLENLFELQDLDIRHNSIRSIAPLKKLTKLTSLSLRGNPILDYSPIRELPNYEPDWESNGSLI